ncbi:hypothetical protein [Solimonas sp. SE-A11]|nr:hypothetical protein [Solimonas sp. SE-A11]MDM4770119.1 hypothetical protein [Solimonas sp. SE-A11]
MSLTQRQMPSLGEVRPTTLQGQRQLPQLPTGSSVAVPQRGPTLPIPGSR